MTLCPHPCALFYRMYFYREMYTDKTNNTQENENFDIIVCDLNNNHHMIHCLGYQHSIEYVKFVLSMKTCINRNMISLYLNDKYLEDSKTLSEYKIDKNSKIMMHFKIKTGFVIAYHNRSNFHLDDLR
jgi:hypothetical protein